jgi:hypothetical protein
MAIGAGYHHTGVVPQAEISQSAAVGSMTVVTPLPSARLCSSAVPNPCSNRTTKEIDAASSSATLLATSTEPCRDFTPKPDTLQHAA